MRRLAALLAAVLVPGLALAGSQVNVDPGTPFFCEFAIAEGGAGIAPGTDAGSCLVPGFALGLLATTSAGANYFIPGTMRLVIAEWGVLITSALVATEDCNLVLQTDTTTAGAGSSVSTLTTGPGATEAECVGGGTPTLDTVGEACTITNLSVNIPGGGFWRVRWDDNDGGGANTCTAWTGGTVWVRGRLLPQ